MCSEIIFHKNYGIYITNEEWKDQMNPPIKKNSKAEARTIYSIFDNVVTLIQPKKQFSLPLMEIEGDDMKMLSVLIEYVVENKLRPTAFVLSQIYDLNPDEKREIRRLFARLGYRKIKENAKYNNLYAFVDKI